MVFYGVMMYGDDQLGYKYDREDKVGKMLMGKVGQKVVFLDVEQLMYGVLMYGDFFVENYYVYENLNENREIKVFGLFDFNQKMYKLMYKDGDIYYEEILDKKLIMILGLND